MSQLDPIAISEILEVIGQIFRPRHLSAMYKHRDDWNVPLQRRSSFEANEIGRFVEPAEPFFILGIEPALADHRKQDTTRGHLLVDNPAKVASRLYCGHIHEYRVFAELRGEILEQAASVSLDIFPSIADKDFTHAILPAAVPG
jgi:hypothetical protein